MTKTITYPKYPAYKDSGVEWLGGIPEGWEAIRMKFLFRDTSIKNKPNEELLSVTQDKGVIPRSWVENRMVMPSGNLESFKFIRKGDFAISLRSFEGGLEFCHHDGIISPAYTVLKIRDGLVEHYYKYLFKSFSFISEIQTSVVGIREGKNISYPELSYSILPIPSTAEQTAIANFLDDKCAKIDRAIAQKEKLIALLKERKQIIIQDLVTGKTVWSEKQKAFVPLAQSEVEGKDSGVAWIDGTSAGSAQGVPVGWEVKRCKYLFYEVNERSVNGTEELLSVSHMTGVTPRSEKDVNMFMAEDYSGSKLCKEGDVIYNIMWAWMGALGVANQAGIVSPSYGVYRQMNTKKFNAAFLEHKLKAAEYIEHYNRVSTGLHSSRLRFYAHMFMNMQIAFPGKVEQDKIVEYIESQSIKIDQAITLQQTQIDKLREYKATLIDSAVRGKIKVS
jgi:type I restriction enzyme S subunit